MLTSIIIRTLNEKRCLAELLWVIQRQDYGGQTEIIVVDNESTDGTRRLARTISDVRVIKIPRDSFSFPTALNRGMEAAKGEVVVCLVGHALPFRKSWLRHGLSHFQDPAVAGVYSPVIPRRGCTWAETFFYWPGYLKAKFRGPHKVPRPGMGVFGATNIALRRDLWEKHPFDERYGLGGEDGEWATWAMSQGFSIVCDHRFAVRHSHGLDSAGLRKQIAYWGKLDAPSTFNRDELRFRKDLQF